MRNNWTGEIGFLLRDAAPESEGGGGPASSSSPPQVDPKDEEIRKLKAALQAPRPEVAQSQPTVTKEDLEKAFWKDPLGMSAAIAAEAARQADQNGGLSTMIEVAKKEARGTNELDQKIWDKYAAEIEAKATTGIAPQYQKNVTVWRNAFNFVKGEKQSEIFEMIKEKSGTPRTDTHDGPSPPGVRAPAASPKSKLTEEQAYIAGKLGVSDDEYRHGLRLRQEQHDKQPSPWDDAITVDNTRRKVAAK